MPTINSFIKNNVEYYQMYIGCPICLKEGRPTVPAYWYHAQDGYDMYIGDNGYYYCKECGYTAPIIEWGYTCAECIGAGHEKSVKLSNLKDIAVAISVAGLVSSKPGIAWLNRLTAALQNQC